VCIEIYICANACPRKQEVVQKGNKRFAYWITNLVKCSPMSQYGEVRLFRDVPPNDMVCVVEYMYLLNQAII